MDITGAVIGVPNISSGFSTIFGIIFIFISVILLISSERRKIESRIEQLVSSGVPRSQIDVIQEGIKYEYKALPKNKRKAIYEEIANVVSEVRGSRRKGGLYELHILNRVPEGLVGVSSGTTLLEADAKILNKYIHQRGRGTERYIFDSSTGKLLGIAYHPRGNPRQLNWRKRF